MSQEANILVNSKAVLADIERYRADKGLKMAALPKAIGVDKRIVQKLYNRNGTSNELRVSRKVIFSLATHFDQHPSRYVYVQPLPEDHNYYLGLKYSYYVDFPPDKAEKMPSWRPESATFSFRGSRPGYQGARRLQFSVRLTNADKVEMKGVAARNTATHFVLSIGGCNSGGIAFDAAFACIYQNVLCGIWVGVDQLHFQTIYRMFLSPRPLTTREIAEIENAVKVSLQDVAFPLEHHNNAP